MSAQHIYDTAPLGAVITYSDGTTKPPARFKRKVSAWERGNGSGRLIQKSPARQLPTLTLPASITLHVGNYGSAGITVVILHKTFDVASRLTFAIAELPRIGSVRILRDAGDSAELLHLASDRAAAEAWLTAHRHPGAILQEVTPDEIASVTGEGRAA